MQTQGESFEHFKRNQIHDILKSAKEKEKHLKSKSKETLLEWSLLTKFDCYSKIFEYESKIGRCLWIIIFVCFSALTAWLLGKYISEYLKYEVVTKTEIVHERPTEFPTITICNNNPFTTNWAQDLIGQIKGSKIITIIQDIFSLNQTLSDSSADIKIFSNFD